MREGRGRVPERMRTRGRGFETGVTKGLRRRHTNGEGKESGLLHREGSLMSLSPMPGEGYIQVHEQFLCVRRRARGDKEQRRSTERAKV